MSAALPPLNLCTIVSANYLAFARVLARSFREHEPEGRVFVLLADRNDGRVQPAEEPFELLEVEALDRVPDLLALLFKYEQLECATALKPFLLQHLLQRGLPNIAYFDPDILIMDSLRHLRESLERHTVVLTPHLDGPLNDTAWPDEQAILQAGIYNLGFIALRREAETERLLEWWSDRLRGRCVVRPDQGLFVDQRWIDLAPGMWSGVHVETHPGYNVAYWNLATRPVRLGANGRATVRERPLLFFHFSGIDIDRLDAVSRHQDRFRLSDIGEAATLYARYRDLLVEAGFPETRGQPYAFGRFDNGVAVPSCARWLYRDLGPAAQRFGDPFRSGPGSFYAWLNERPGRGRLTRLTRYLARARPELARTFPDAEGGDRARFVEWLRLTGARQFGLAAPFLDALPAVRPSARAIVRGGLRAAYHSAPSRASREALKKFLGPRRTARWRRRWRPAEQPAATGRFRLAPPARLELAGVNVYGCLQAETGMGQAARGLVRALQAAGYPVSARNLDLTGGAPQQERSLDVREPVATDFDVNLFVVNADQIQRVRRQLGGRAFAGKYNIGYWAWELESFPLRWQASFDWLHEIWTLSSFCQDAIAGVAPVPVCRVPLPVDVARPTADRGRFDLPADRIVFLFVFNYLSQYERKNPVACVRAFRRAFGPEAPVLLVLKSAGEDFAFEQADRLRAEIGGDPRVRLLEGYLDREALSTLMAAADVYVSLHRSEGFGLTVAEAMALGKPVVATGYSGVTDFFGAHNGYPVGYHLVELERAAGPYDAGARWAEPDVEHAAGLLRQVVDDQERSSALARRGQEDVRRQLSTDAVAAIVERRLRTLRERFGGAPVA